MFYVTGSWIVPRNGSAGMDGQFVSEEEAKTFATAQGFDHAVLSTNNSPDMPAIPMATYADGQWRSARRSTPGPTETK